MSQGLINKKELCIIASLFVMVFYEIWTLTNPCACMSLYLGIHYQKFSREDRKGVVLLYSIVGSEMEMMVEGYQMYYYLVSTLKSCTLANTKSQVLLCLLAESNCGCGAEIPAVVQFKTVIQFGVVKINYTTTKN